jgi:DNA-binding transcriptional regulator LsrR (DeoR family)
MADSKDVDITLRRKTLAYLMATQGLSEKEAAERLDGRFGRYSTATASRDLKEAKERGWYRAVFAKDACSPEELKAIEVYAHCDEKLEMSLKKASQGALRHFRVFPSGLPAGPVAPAEWDRALALFGRRTSGYVRELLTQTRVVGVGWGHTMAEVVEGVRAHGALAPGRKASARWTVVPTAGEPLGEGPSSRSSSALAAKLNEIMGGTKRYSLLGVPPVIPEEFQGRKRAIVVDFIGHLRSYREIFGDLSKPRGRGLIDAADCVLTSAGSFHSWMMYKNELVTIGGIPKERLLELSAGDIGGVLIPREGLSKADNRAFQRISSLWTGITLEHYRRVAAAANVPRDHPGVMLCACGRNKANIVRALVARVRVVNTLIVDDTLADALRDGQPAGLKGE